MNDQLPILQEMDEFLKTAKLKEIFERVISNSGYDTVAHALDLTTEVRDQDVIQFMLRIFFTQLKLGILYVYEKFGMVAGHFVIDGDNCIGKIGQFVGYTVRYVPQLDCITIDYESLAIACTSIMHNISVSLVPLEYYGKDCRVNIKDAVFLSGVEEAHHAYYMRSKNISTYKEPLTLEEYKRSPVELAAGTVVRKAIKEHGIQIYYSI